MNRLFKKYIDDTITAEELKELRQTVSKMSDEELASWFTPDLMDADEPSSEDVPLETHESRRMPLWGRIVISAAAVLIPLLLLTSTYLFVSNRAVSGQMVRVSTGLGEHTGVTLPDGSRVRLNSNSSLSYQARDFASGSRLVSLTGEGYFEVTKQQGHHFIVKGREFNVEVKGTRFNVRAYDADKNVTVTLDQGSVSLTNNRGNAVDMRPGQVSVLDRHTGQISLMKNDEYRSNTAWMRNELVVQQQTLREIQARLTEVYGVHFINRRANMPSGTFSGTLPTNNLYAALEVLETAYKIHAEIHGTSVAIE